MGDLFRREAVEQHQSRRFGSSLSITPLSFKLFAAFVLLLVAAIGSFLYWGSYDNKQTVSGYILPSLGVVTVHAPQRGTIMERYVELGDHVSKGQKLYRIASRRSTMKTQNVNAVLLKKYNAQLQNIQAHIKSSKRLKTAKVAQLEAQKYNLGIERKRVAERLKTEYAILTLTRNNVSRYQKLARTGMVSKSDLQKVQQKMLTQQTAVGQIKKTQIVLRSQIEQIPAEISQIKSGTASKISELKNQVAQIERQRLQLSVAEEVIVRAPTDGVVSSVIMRVGQNVTLQSPLASILPTGSVFEARLLVPTRAIGFVQAGEPVRLRYNAFPYQQFGLYRGKVSKVSRSIVVPGELRLPVQVKKPYYLVTASLAKPYVRAYGKKLPLTAGMTLSADIVLHRERLYEWVLRPIESLRGRW